jgi:hypothetical protein
MAYSYGPSYPNTAYILTLIGGIFVILAGLVDAMIYAVIGSAFLAIFPGIGALLIGLAVLALLVGVIMVYGALQLKHHPESAKTWGIIIIVLSLVSWIGGGGFFIGFLLGLIGGILALVWNPPAPAGQMGQPYMNQPPPMAPPLGAASPMGGAPPRFCSSCGSPNATTSQFCAKCGAAMPAQ